MRTYRSVAITLTLVLSWLLLRCSSSPVAGNGSDVGNGVVMGVLYKPDGTYAAGASVCLLGCSHVPSAADTVVMPKALAAAAPADTLMWTTADDKGKYRFDNVLPGCYNMQAKLGVLGAFIDSVSMSDALAGIALDDTLLGISAVVGTTQLAPAATQAQAGIKVYIVGTTHMAELDSSGRFVLLGIAQGSYTLWIVPADSAYAPTQVGVTVAGPDSVVASPSSVPTGERLPSNVVSVA